MSAYQNAKLEILSILELSRDSIHIHIGLIVFFATVVLWKRGYVKASCLIPVAVVASLMEILDLRDGYIHLGYFRMAAVTASIHDLINTMVWPVVIVLLAWMGRLKDARNA